MRLRDRLALAFVALALAACGAAPPPAPELTPAPATAIPPPVATATAVPSAPAAIPTAAPTAATPLPSPAAAPTQLPAPAYALVRVGAAPQVVRVAPDGRAAARITFEPQPVLDFDVAAEAGALVYIYGDETASTLAVLDGGGRRELLSGQLSAPRVSPDGRQIVVRVDGIPAAGVYWLASAGGPPELLLADDSAAGQGPPDGEAWAYTPVAFRPGGRDLLLWAYNIAGPAIPGGELAILDMVDGMIMHSEPTCCEGSEWSVDGAAITVVGGPPGPDIRFGLYRIDAASGAEQALVAQGDSYPLLVGARQLADNDIYAFYEDVAQSDYSWDYPFALAMVRVAADGTITPLRADRWPVSSALWRADASGALVAVRDTPGGESLDGRLVWLPASGASALSTDLFGWQMRWADTGQPLSAGDCALLPPTAWQPPATRAYAAGVADLQGRLSALGFDAGPADGFFGDATRAALRQFQASRSLPQGDGLDCATWQSLLEAR